jgi:hypothetical protein
VSDVKQVDITPEQSPPAEEPLWFRVEEVEIRWLPVGEVAFLLWVLVALIAVWLGIGVALGLV